MRTGSLRRRVAATSLVLIAVTVLALDGFVYVSLDARLTADLRSRLSVSADLAQRLAPDVPPERLAERLSAGGVAATLSRGGAVVARARPPAPGPPGARPPKGRAAAPGVVDAGDAVRLTRPLPGGTTLTLTAGRGEIRSTLSRLVALELVGSAAVLALAALMVWRLVGAALRPLDAMTGVALRIARGRTGERLRPTRTDTEIGRTAAAFDEMLDSLETALLCSRASEERMREFVADASHELRTPVAGVQATAETLLRDGGDRASREALAVQIVREARRASRLVGDLLETARLARGLELDREDIDLVALVRAEVERLSRLAPGLELHVDAPARCRVPGDRERIGQVVANLLENARHATQGHGRVDVLVGYADARAVVEVSDAGPGVPSGDRERIFERFIRLDGARARDRFGSGLGLAIARGLAEAHGGSLRCEPPRGGGARFVLRLPGSASRGQEAGGRTEDRADPVQDGRPVDERRGVGHARGEGDRGEQPAHGEHDRSVDDRAEHAVHRS